MACPLDCDAVPDKPSVEVFTIKGRMIDIFSKKPVPNIAIYTKVVDGAPLSDPVYTNNNGEFAFTTTTEVNPTTNTKAFPFWPKCYKASSSIVLSKKIDVSHLFPGTYVLRLQSDEGVVARKFVVHR